MYDFMRNFYDSLKHKKSDKSRLYRVPGTHEIYELSDWQAPTGQQPGGYGTKRHISSPEAFESEYGAEGWGQVKDISAEELGKYQLPREGGKKMTDIYDFEGLKKSLMSAGEQKKGAYEAMMGLEGKLYEKEYSAAGLDKYKTQIEQLDTDIRTRKADMESRTVDAKGNPIPQWMITGRVKNEIDAARADINQITDERNSFADRFNKGIDNVARKVSYGLKDAETKYNYWAGEEAKMGGMMESYQNLLVGELGTAEEKEMWEKELAQKMEIARMGRRTGGGGTSGGGASGFSKTQRLKLEQAGLSGADRQTQLNYLYGDDAGTVATEEAIDWSPETIGQLKAKGVRDDDILAAAKQDGREEEVRAWLEESYSAGTGGKTVRGWLEAWQKAPENINWAWNKFKDWLR